MRILIMLRAGANPQTGVVPEYNGLIEAYYLFSDAGADVVLAAPGGGSASESPATRADHDDAAVVRLRRFNADRQAREVMNDLVDLNHVCTEDFDAALCLTAQGVDGCGGAKDDADVLMDRLLAAAKPVAVIVLGPDHSTVGNGLLMVASGSEAARLAANALLGVASNR